MTRFGLTLLALLASAAAAAPIAALKPEQFAWQQEIALGGQGSGQQAIYRFELPQSVYQGATRRDLGDLRVFNAAGEVVPHALLHYAPPLPNSVQTTPLNFFPLYRDAAAAQGRVSIEVRQRADGSLIAARVDAGAAARATPQLAGYVLDASAIKSPLVALIAEWPAPPNGTVLPLQVEASDDLQAWRSVTAAAQLVDLSFGGQRLRRNRVELDAVSARYWRLSWPAGHEAIALTSIAAETSTQAARASPLRWSPAAPRPGEKAGEFVFEAGGLPVEALRLTLPQANTVAPLRVFHRGSEREPWREAANAVAYRLQRDAAEVVAPPITVCCSSDRFWRVAFDQRGGGIGEGIPQIELGWVAQQALFVARGAAPFRLAYGSRLALPTDFDAATLVPGYRPEEFPLLPEARLAPALRAAAGSRAAPALAVDWRSIGLWSILGLGVLALGAMTWRLLREMNAKTDRT